MPEFLLELYVPREAAASARSHFARARVAAAELTRAGSPVRCLRTIYGPLNFSAKGNVVKVSGVRVPPGGIVLMLPNREPKTIRSVPAEVKLAQ